MVTFHPEPDQPVSFGHQNHMAATVTEGLLDYLRVEHCIDFLSNYLFHMLAAANNHTRRSVNVVLYFRYTNQA